ncbi:hypothetical protein D5086_000517 [Populus alba]|uniref:Uncharacterized protein n=2 Tax=Populus alba TaxID=43335 RepID=A0ACC4CW26_POPAL|nr:hypothetical protein D5086_0000269340 [Populus alba]
MSLTRKTAGGFTELHLDRSRVMNGGHSVSLDWTECWTSTPTFGHSVQCDPYSNFDDRQEQSNNQLSKMQLLDADIIVIISNIISSEFTEKPRRGLIPPTKSTRA